MNIHYPETLPISAHHQAIIDAIQKHEVTIIRGETGSGKSTQIAKMVYEALGRRGMGACTQPRRIAAMAIAARIAEECEVLLGTKIGHKIRFDDLTTPQTKIVICTDGILLQEAKTDALFSKYDAIFIDEAHERSLRIDFLLGLLKNIQKKRLEEKKKPLKIIIASATLDSEKFVSFFANQEGRSVDDIAVFQIDGRMFPVDVVYEPLPFHEDFARSFKELFQKIYAYHKHGDILIFLPGEQEIILTMQAIDELNLPNLKCLPLFSRLALHEQNAIFVPHPGKRHVIVSTNIAETSLTVPGVTIVIDSGLARMTDFDTKTGVGSLMVQKISQASAIQRTGRAGRIEPGVCYRLYSREDFMARRAHTLPEIQRSDLADIVLQMVLMGIPDIHSFDFIDPPDHHAFENAFETLRILGAINYKEHLTDLGYKMAYLPLDPRISRMLIAAEKYDVVVQTAVIASFLSVKDPFMRPLGEEDEADKAQDYFQRLGMPSGKKMMRGRFFNAYSGNSSYFSDLLTYLAIWKKVFLIEHEEERKQYCLSHYINFQTLEEIKAIYLQLVDTLAQFGGKEFGRYLDKSHSMLELFNLQKPLDHFQYIGILKAIASGLIQNLAQRNNYGNYTSKKVDRIVIHPSSMFFNRRPAWIIPAEIIETTKLFARKVTEIDPNWLSEIAPQLNLNRKKPSRKSQKDRLRNRNKKRYRSKR